MHIYSRCEFGERTQVPTLFATTQTLMIIASIAAQIEESVVDLPREIDQFAYFQFYNGMLQKVRSSKYNRGPLNQGSPPTQKGPSFFKGLAFRDNTLS
ncbi:unnamed protein product [Paramecium octaurelia]|uniref:Uncharacterized protein n=1 Tax=Paramecium octaurelia TaxID=43137 RepID=A0A8S1YLS7_PAROT|nr:unnamed protein product [Paramecium octaurelia]